MDINVLIGINKGNLKSVLRAHYFIGWVVGLLVLVAMPVGGATPTQEQLRMLQSLNSTQRDQLMNYLSGGVKSKRVKKTQERMNTTPGLARDKLAREELVVEPLLGSERLASGDTLILYMKPGQTDQSQKNLTASQLLFQLTQEGILSLPNLGNIPLGGLTVEDAVARLSLEPFFTGYTLEIKRLPLTSYGPSALQPFGYDLFRQSAGDMQPTSNIPVPANYIVGPGDVVHIQLIGKENQEYILDVSRDGTLAFPGIGSIPVTGLRFDEVKANLLKRVARQFIGVSANVTLGELRSMRVFVLGEVKFPGSYIVGALASMTNALMQVGGVKPIGSLRNVILKRKGKVVKQLDLYELLLHGDTRNDVRLQPDDVVYVPPVKTVVGVAGAVTRPGLYELMDDKSIANVLAMTGGVLPQANKLRAQVERYTEMGLRQVIDIDFNGSLSEQFQLQSGDILSFAFADRRINTAVHVDGNVTRQGWVQWKPEMRLADILSGPADVKPNSDLSYVVMTRQLPPAYELEAFSVDLLDVFSSPQSRSNVTMMPNDHIYVLENKQGRNSKLSQIVSQLMRQSTQDQAARIVRVSGNVHFPDTYPLEKDMRISDLVRAGGGLKDSSFVEVAELTRFIVKPGLPREITHLTIKLANAVIKGQIEADIKLQAYDLLHIKEVPHWAEQDQVEVLGEVNYPGRYPIQRGETLSELLSRAGGVTKNSYAAGAVFMREELRKREQQRLDEMSTNLEGELASINLERGGDISLSDQGVAPQLLKRLRNTKAAGRLVIDLDTLISTDGESSDIILRGGDKLFIPPKMQEVTVMGEVFYPTSHLFREGLGVNDYKNLSGGATQKADEGNMYVIRANGAVELAVTDWFDDETAIFPGDTIVVPLDADRVSHLKLWSSVSSIIYQLGLSAAAWNSLGLIK